MKRPLCSVTLLYIAGILLGEWIHPSAVPLFGVCFLLTAAAMAWGKGRIYLLTASLLVAGWLNMDWRATIIAPADLRNVLGPETDSAAVRGVLHNSPVARIFEMQGREEWRSTVMLDATEVRLGGEWKPATGRVLATVPGTLASNYFEGQRVEAAGDLGPLRGPLAMGLFNPKAYYARIGVYYQLRTRTMESWKVEPSSPPLNTPLADQFSAWARKMLAMGLGPEDAATRLMWTLALDWKAPLTDTVEEPFMRAGTFVDFAFQ